MRIVNRSLNQMLAESVEPQGGETNVIHWLNSDYVTRNSRKFIIIIVYQTQNAPFVRRVTTILAFWQMMCSRIVPIPSHVWNKYVHAIRSVVFGIRGSHISTFDDNSQNYIQLNPITQSGNASTLNALDLILQSKRGECFSAFFPLCFGSEPLEQGGGSGWSSDAFSSLSIRANKGKWLLTTTKITTKTENEWNEAAEQWASGQSLLAVARL